MEKTSKTRGIITFIIAIIAVIVMIATSGLLGLILYLFAVVISFAMIFSSCCKSDGLSAPLHLQNISHFPSKKVRTFLLHSHLFVTAGQILILMLHCI